MGYSPKDAEEKMLKYLNALKTLAPDKTFGGFTLAQVEAQVNKSRATRTRLDELENQKTKIQTERDKEDEATMKMCDKIKNGVVDDDEFGDDSALYEALGYVRRSEKKSGLTRRKKIEPVK